MSQEGNPPPNDVPEELNSDSELPDLPRSSVPEETHSDDEEPVRLPTCTLEQVINVLIEIANPFSGVVEVEDFFETKEE